MWGCVRKTKPPGASSLSSLGRRSPNLLPQSDCWSDLLGSQLWGPLKLGTGPTPGSRGRGKDTLTRRGDWTSGKARSFFPVRLAQQAGEQGLPRPVQGPLLLEEGATGNSPESSCLLPGPSQALAPCPVHGCAGLEASPETGAHPSTPPAPFRPVHPQPCRLAHLADEQPGQGAGPDDSGVLEHSMIVVKCPSKSSHWPG